MDSGLPDAAIDRAEPPEDGSRDGDRASLERDATTGDGEARPDESCNSCSSDLSAAFSLACFCAAEDCPASIEDLSPDETWKGEFGCSLVRAYYQFGAGDGTHFVFDANTGELVGGSRSTDVVGGCLTPTGENRSGGIFIDGFDGLAHICDDVAPCRIDLDAADAAARVDAGGDSIDAQVGDGDSGGVRSDEDVLPACGR